MKRSKWDVCFNAYTKECTRIVIFKESLKAISIKFKISMFGSVLLFALFLVLAFFSSFDDDKTMYGVYFAIFLFFEGASLILIFKAQTIYKKEEYSDKELSQVPPEDYKDQKVRYLKFRRTLSINEITQEQIVGILEILESRIAVNEHSGISVQKVFGFSITFAMAILVATMKSLDSATIAQIGAIGGLAIAFFYILMSLKPNKLEQLYELKYFLTMFANEDRT